jgi:hypothetical protein
MVRAVENKTFAYERTYSEIKRHASAGLDGPPQPLGGPSRSKPTASLRSTRRAI